MVMQINTNLGALGVQGSLNKNSMSLSTSMERLSTGLRVNSAKDDAAGLAIGDRMNSQIRGMTVAIRNANDGISMAQTAEFAMGTITDTLQRMRDLGVQAANMGAVGSGDRQKLQLEFKQLGLEIKRIVDNTTFNDKKILAGSMKGANFQVGAGTATNNQISITVSNLMSVGGVKAVASATPGVSIGSTAGSAKIRSAIDSIDLAIKNVDNFRATLGAVQNRFTTTIANLQSSVENQSAAKSRIMDADFAAETASLSRSQILQQAGTAMLAQANQSGQGVLSLLR
ncbi:flagellin [Methylobacter tundripaludum]|uniref:Flagellin n=1 Tax=Methylobacter tundripaludum (strain ATCC BAA-1195 / DSM 17260 / SV96) TaxID=697282 RepID=G3ISY6_METTV|nr:flagellin [Methylobacter tundripaludum]EGW22460.1 flagellin domain protein [Methylobacter tundripaludum SV96]